MQAKIGIIYQNVIKIVVLLTKRASVWAVCLSLSFSLQPIARRFFSLRGEKKRFSVANCQFIVLPLQPHSVP
jgi:hypothetical protein